MSNKYKKRYLDYADKIPYSPDINSFGVGGAIAAAAIEAGGNGTVDALNSIKAKQLAALLENIENIQNTLNGYTTALNYLDALTESRQARLALATNNTNLFNIGGNLEGFLNSNFLGDYSLNKPLGIDESYKLYNKIQKEPYKYDPLAQAKEPILKGGSSFGEFISKAPGAIGAIQSALKGATSFIAKDYESDTANIADAIDVTGVTGAILRGLTGIKTDKENLAKTLGTILTANQITLNAATANSLDDNSLTASVPTMNIGRVYSGGIFSKNKANIKENALKNQMNQSISTAERTLENAILNIISDTSNRLLGNYAAYGGNLSDLNTSFKKDKIYNLTEELYNKLIEEGYLLEVIK